MYEPENVYCRGTITYVIERVFTGNKAPRDVIIEEIITTAKQDNRITY